MARNGKGLSRPAYVGIWSAVFAVLLAVMIILTTVLQSYDSIITTYLGTVGGGLVTREGEVDTQYFKTDADYTPENLAAMNMAMAREAIVLLRNERNALPMTMDKPRVTLFGMASTAGSSTGTGSGEAGSTGASLIGALQNAGFTVNEQVVEHYRAKSTAHGIGTAAGGGADKGEWSLGSEAEFPTGALADTFAEYSDAAIFVLNRGCGEGGDLPRTMNNHGGTAEQNYLELSDSERATLEGIRASGKFDRIIVIANTGNPMELGFLEEYDVDAALWYAGLGTVGMDAVGEILAGKVNPSGRLPDTYVYDNLSAPATANQGDYRFLIDGKDSGQAYVNYAEGIYIGYRYYETRYEDVVMGTPNAGDYDYAKTVLFPFGHGLSYTTFAWKNYSMKVSGDRVTVSLDVENTGAVSGRDVVQVYFQSPYTEYDRANRIEKAAVNLVAFGKTGEIAPGKSEHVEISFPLNDMKSYDAYGEHKTYILEAGDYYITAARNAHEAANNILLKKNFQNIVGTGDAANAAVHTVKSTAAVVKSAPNGTDVTNQFDAVALDAGTYLSRSNWAVMDAAAGEGLNSLMAATGLTTATGTGSGSNTMGASGLYGTLEMPKNVQAIYELKGYEASGNPKDIGSYSTEHTYKAENGLELSDLRGVPYDDPTWDKLLDQMKYSEIYELFGHAGYGTIEIKSINKPKTLEYDGPTGINSFVNDTKGYSYPNEISMAATWNDSLVFDEGRLIGNDMIMMSSGTYRVSGWYAPAVNTHRSAFSGRNYEYYSEDPVLSGRMVASVLKGVQSKGAYVYMKHFALNDQETNRSGNGRCATFATEQAIREIYLKPFELGVVDGGATGIMTSNNRVGMTYACASYPMITAVLKNEWDFHGAVITDYTSGVPAEMADQILAAGGNLIMTSAWNNKTGVLTDFNADWARDLLRKAAHDNLYMQANSLVMNGFSHGVAYNPGFPVYKIILYAVWAVVGLFILIRGFFVYRTLTWSAERWENRKRITKKGWITIWCIVGVVLVALVILFFIFIWPELSKALVM